MKDFNDTAFFDDASVPAIRRLVQDGMDVGSHTVAHSDAFGAMPLGSGKERYPAYRPFVVTEQTVRGASILGELRVSKFLLEELAGAKVQAFRPGRLSYPFSLPQAMAGTGYAYSSSISANIVLTHLPFQLTDGRADGALQPVWEFPVTIEDEAPPRLGDRLEEADRLVEQIARHQGVVTVLIHPNITDHKLRFEAALADRWRGRAWMGSVSDFGAWWRARDALETDVALENGRWVLRATASEPVNAVAVRLPKAGRSQVRLDLAGGSRAEVPLQMASSP
jgi:peptidoglycan/xylan/chitin deacetylase (PgdA/CDA1 family)